MNEIQLDVAGQCLVINAERAIWWRYERRLLVADIHFGKGSVLRQSGIAVPSGQTATDLERLDRLIERYRPREILVLGDLVHGRSATDAPWVSKVREWRERHATIAMCLVEGNHDRHFSPQLLGFEVVEAELFATPFVLRHAPGYSAKGYVLAGHVHPGVVVPDGWRRHRLPAFRFGSRIGVLPAFGSLTGLHEESAKPDERVFAVTPAGLLDVTRRASNKPSVGP